MCSTRDGVPGGRCPCAGLSSGQPCSWDERASMGDRHWGPVTYALQSTVAWMVQAVCGQ